MSHTGNDKQPEDPVSMGRTMHYRTILSINHIISLIPYAHVAIKPYNHDLPAPRRRPIVWDPAGVGWFRIGEKAASSPSVSAIIIISTCYHSLINDISPRAPLLATEHNEATPGQTNTGAFHIEKPARPVNALVRRAHFMPSIQQARNR